MDLSGEGDAWRVELIGLGVPAGLITAAQAEVRVIHVRAELHSELLPAPDDAVSGVIEHVKILGEPAQWETATTYESLALALMDAIWSIGVRYAGVVNVINRYRGARRRDGADPTRTRRRSSWPSSRSPAGMKHSQKRPTTVNALRVAAGS